MTFGRALLKSLVPALLIGPMLGLLGALVVLLISVITSGGNSGAGGVFVFGAIIGAVSGLIFAGPACLVAGAIMLVLASRNLVWAKWQPVAAIGVLVGGLVGFFVFGLNADGWATLVMTASGAGLGAVGALVFRRMVLSELDEFYSIDLDTFA